jgi:hypothetical protein
MHAAVRACTWHVSGRRGETDCPAEMTLGWLILWRVLIMEDD